MVFTYKTSTWNRLPTRTFESKRYSWKKVQRFWKGETLKRWFWWLLLSNRYSSKENDKKLARRNSEKNYNLCEKLDAASREHNEAAVLKLPKCEFFQLLFKTFLKNLEKCEQQQRLNRFSFESNEKLESQARMFKSFQLRQRIEYFDVINILKFEMPNEWQNSCSGPWLRVSSR